MMGVPGISSAASGVAHWPRQALSEADEAALMSKHWRKRPVEIVRAVAEAWNAGMTTAEMAADLGCNAGALRITIGVLVQAGVQMRRAHVPRTPPPIATIRRGVETVERTFDHRADRLLRRFSWEV